MKKHYLMTGLAFLSFALICTLLSDCCFAQGFRRNTTRSMQRQRPTQNSQIQSNTRSISPPAQQLRELPLPVEQSKKSFTSQEFSELHKKAQPIFTDRKWHVVLFAVNSYDDEEQHFDPLNGCNADMLAIQDDWLIPMGVPRENIRFLHDGAHDSKMKPTATNFENAIDDCLRDAKNDDIVLIAVACHGIAYDSKSYLVPIDYQCPKNDGTIPSDDIHYFELSKTEVGPERDRYIKARRLIEVSEIIAKLNASHAANKLLIIDACREKNLIDKEEHDFMKEFQVMRDSLDSSSTGLGVLTSCSLGEFAREIGNDNLARGVFLRCFIEGIRTGNANLKGVLDGEITLAKAYAYAYSETQLIIDGLNKIEQVDYRQRPEIFYNSDAHRFVLAKTGPAQNHAEKSDVEFVYDTSLFLINNAQQKVDASLYKQQRTQTNQRLNVQKNIYTSAIRGLDYVALEQPNNANVYVNLSSCYLNRNLYRVGNDYHRFGKFEDKKQDIQNALKQSQKINKPLELYAENFIKDFQDALDSDPNLMQKYQERLTNLRAQYIDDDSQFKQLEEELRAEINDTLYSKKIDLFDQSKTNVVCTVDYGQKISATDMQGDYLWVHKVGDDMGNVDLGWVHINNVEWKPENVEWYRPITPLRPQGQYGQYRGTQVQRNMTQFEQTLQAAQIGIGIANSFGANIPGEVSMGIGIAQSVIQFRQMSPAQRQQAIRERIRSEIRSRISIPYVGSFL